MKTLTLCMCSMAVAITALAQTPPSPPPPTSPNASASVAASASPAQDLADKIHQRIEKKLKGHHGITIDGDDKDIDLKSDDIPEFVLPIVVVTMLTVFGAPVLIVAFIMYFGFSKSRMQHRTVRMLAEKGQPIPAALLAPPTPALRQRNDMRRGIVLVMIGLGLMICFGAWNDWEGGAWAIGVIPFVIGLGYLLVWKLEGDKKNEIPPPPPTS